MNKSIWVIVLAMVSLMACGKQPDPKQENIGENLSSENRLREYPFIVGFGADLEELFRKEGKITPAKGNDFLAIYEYARTWQGYMGTLSYLYLREDDAIVALSFDIPLIADVSLDSVLARANELYIKGTPELYELFFELEEGEGQRLVASPEHDQLFFKDHYAINITQESQAGLINILYSYVNFDHDHQHAHSYEHDH